MYFQTHHLDLHPPAPPRPRVRRLNVPRSRRRWTRGTSAARLRYTSRVSAETVNKPRNSSRQEPTLISKTSQVSSTDTFILSEDNLNTISNVVHLMYWFNFISQQGTHPSLVWAITLGWLVKGAAFTLVHISRPHICWYHFFTLVWGKSDLPRHAEYLEPLGDWTPAPL